MESIYETARKCGLTLLFGQKDFLDRWYTSQDPKTEISPPKIAWFSVGRRGGTTTLLSLCALHDAVQILQDWPVKTINLPHILVLVPNKDNIHGTIRLIKTLARVYTNKYSRLPVQDGIRYESDRDRITLWDSRSPLRKVYLDVRAADPHNIRGISIHSAYLDTVAHFKDPEAVYSALTPMVTANACRVLAASTPEPNSPNPYPVNFFNRMWHQGKGLAAHFPSWYLNPDLGTQENLRENYNRWSLIPEHFDIEFGAKVPPPVDRPNRPPPTH